MCEFRVRETDDDKEGCWCVADGDNAMSTNNYVDSDGYVSNWCIIYTSESEAQGVLDLYLSTQKFPQEPTAKDIKPTNPKDALAINKAPLSTLPAGPMYEVALAMLEGARKYGRHNYRIMGVKASVYYDAAMGHLTSWWEGEDIDPASGIHHLGKAMACLAVVRDGQMMENWIDDRPPCYPNGEKLMRNNSAVETILTKYPDCVEPFTELNKNQKR